MLGKPSAGFAGGFFVARADKAAFWRQSRILLRGNFKVTIFWCSNRGENTVETGSVGQKNQKKNKKSLTEAAWRCITRSRRCGTECLAEPGRAERPGRRGEQVF